MADELATETVAEAAQEIIDWHDEKFPWTALPPRIARLRAALASPEGLDVERLAKAMTVTSGGIGGWEMRAAAIAREYARFSDTGERPT